MADRVINPASSFSASLLTALIRGGVRDIVVCPGSRSQSLALVAAELAALNAVRVHVRIDERVAGFLALGFAIETGVPAPVIVTSGTAAANLHPAVLEAHHSGVPMLLLTADRPEELRRVGSNQTTHQSELFGPAVRWVADVPAPDAETSGGDHHRAALRLADEALAIARGETTRDPGPVQLNLAFREPLSADADQLPELLAELGFTTDASDASDVAESPDARKAMDARKSPDAAAATDARKAPDAAAATSATATSRETSIDGTAIHAETELDDEPLTVVIAGHGAGPSAEQFARDGGWPLVAEVASGARFGPNAVPAYRALLEHPDFGQRARRAVVFGRPTLSREIPAFLGRADLDVVVVAPRGREPYNPHRVARVIARSARRADDARAAPREWAGRWAAASRSLIDAAAEDASVDVELARAESPADQARFAKAELDVLRAPVTRRMLVDALWSYTWPHDRLVLAASRLIRDADAAVPGKKVRVHANRGLAGIDGTVSTAIGIALASQADAAERGRVTGVTRALVGDLALLHDVGALLFPVGEAAPHLQVIVGNDGGGTIFDTLEVANSASRASFDRVMLTPHSVEIGALAAAYGWHHVVAATRGQLDSALSSPPEGVSVLEVPLPR